MSSATLRRRLASEGTCFRDLWARVRLTEAKRLLETTDLGVGEIGARVGFSEGCSFGRFFKQVTSLSARAYRESIRR
jgi:transcriptional regulator GlxA family with amidase domain